MTNMMNLRMIDDQNYNINVTAWPVTQILVTEPSTAGSIDPDSFLIKVKIKVNLVCASSNTSTTSNKSAIKFPTTKYSGEYPVSRQDLISDDGTPKSRSWNCMSELIGQISYYIPFSMDKVLWVDHKRPSQVTPLETRDQLVTLVLKTARSIAVRSTVDSPTQAIRRHLLYLSIKKKIFLDHDRFVNILHVIKQKRTFRETFNICISQLQPPLDAEVVKREITKSFSTTNIMHLLSEKVTDKLTDWVLTELNQRETKLVTEDDIDHLESIIFDNLDNEECAVCKEEIYGGEFATKLGCSHVYHADCIKQLLLPSNLCPLCRVSSP